MAVLGTVPKFLSASTLGVEASRKERVVACGKAAGSLSALGLMAWGHSPKGNAPIFFVVRASCSCRGGIGARRRALLKAAPYLVEYSSDGLSTPFGADIVDKLSDGRVVVVDVDNGILAVFAGVCFPWLFDDLQRSMRGTD